MNDVTQNDEVAVTVEGQAVVVTDTQESEVNPFARPAAPARAAGGVRAPRNMSAHDRVFGAADVLTEEFSTLTGVEGSFVATRTNRMRGARVLFDVAVEVEGVEILDASRNDLTMEEALTFLAGARAMLGVISSLNPENEAIDPDLMESAAA